MELLTKLPKSFDEVIYREQNPDLKDLSHEELLMHYQLHGKREGRVCSQVNSLQAFVRLFPLQGDILEIGQLDKPLSQKAKNIDIMNLSDLKQYYVNDPSVDTDRLRPVDYLITDTHDWRLDQTFDAVISSHNIEHAPCLVLFLKNIEAALKPDGCAYFVIPDYRYCFDRYKFPSTIIDVLDAFYSGRKQPSVGNMLEYSLLSKSNDTHTFWNEPLVIDEMPYFSLTTEQLQSVLNRDLTKYHDGHCWKLTPEHFTYIVDQLYALGLVNLKPIRVYPTLSGELQFFAILQKKTATEK